MPESGSFRAARKWFVAIVVVALLAGGGFLLFKNRAKQLRFRLVAVSLGTVTQTVSASGTLSPTSQQTLSFSAAGRVASVDVTLGQSVANGASLASLDATSLQAQVAAAQASLYQAQAKLANDQAAPVNSQGVSSVSPLTLEADQAQVSAAQDSLSAAQATLSQATLVAPFAGTIAALNMAVGQAVTAGGGANAPSITIVSTGSFVIQSSVSDTQIGQVKVGDQAVITPDGSTTSVYGTVSQVVPVSLATSGVASYPVTISVTGNPPGLFIGAGAQVSVIVTKMSNVLVVPVSALHSVGSRTFVVQDIAGKQVPQTVGVGAMGQTFVQITSGLKIGDQIVLARLNAKIPTLSGAGAKKGFFGGGGGGGGGKKANGGLG